MLLRDIYRKKRTNKQRLTESSSHSGLEPIGSGAGQHFVDADDVERMDAKTHVESVLAHELHHVLVGANTRSCGRREERKKGEEEERWRAGRKMELKEKRGIGEEKDEEKGKERWRD